MESIRIQTGLGDFLADVQLIDRRECRHGEDVVARQQWLDAIVRRIAHEVDRQLYAALAAGQERVVMPDPLVPGRHVVYDLRPALVPMLPNDLAVRH